MTSLATPPKKEASVFLFPLADFLKTDWLRNDTPGHCCKTQYVAAACWDDKHGHPVVHPMFIKQKLNSLLFTCAVQKGLADVIMEMLSFEGAELKMVVSR